MVQRLFFATMIAAIAAVFASILLINLPAPALEPVLRCSEWREHTQIRKDAGAAGSHYRNCINYKWSEQ